MYSEKMYCRRQVGGGCLHLKFHNNCGLKSRLEFGIYYMIIIILIIIYYNYSNNNNSFSNGPFFIYGPK